MVSQTDLVLLGLVGLGALLFLFRDALFNRKYGSGGGMGSKLAGENGHAVTGGGAGADDGTGSDFVAKLAAQNKRIAIFYGSQTGTAEEYATKIAKEAKARFGTSSLVLDLEEYEFDKLDAVPSDSLVIFVMATYGEGEPTDNAVQFMEFISDDAVSFSQGGDRLDNLNYVVFGLGNRTYEHFNAVARKLDERLASLGAKRIAERGEGDDDKSMEEDYLAWKDGMFASLTSQLGFEEGGGGDVADFVVRETDSLDDKRVYRGELSARALLGTKGIHDAKNPFPAPVAVTRELFNQAKADRSCVHIEFDIDGSGISYQHGDHVAVWPTNPEREVERLLSVLGLREKRNTVIEVDSLDPTLAKVPFPTPTTYETIFRHYMDISAKAGRQTLNAFVKFAPSDRARAELERLTTDKAYFQSQVADRSLKVGEVLQLAAGDDVRNTDSATAWPVPFDRVISAIPRLGPRFYSISSSPKLHPKTVHVTAVVLRYEPKGGERGTYVHGLATNMLSSLKMAINAEPAPSSAQDPRFGTPHYLLDGPRGAYTAGGKWRAPIHIRRSNFRLPTSPKIPVIMVGPGTGVAPFRSFVQERVAAADKVREKAAAAASGADAPAAADPLADWGNIWLFYGCRRSDEDFLYADEWPQYASKLSDKFRMETAVSREKFAPDGSKLYVQHLIWNRRKELAQDILERKAYIYICGEAKGMAHDVEAVFQKILVEAKGSEQDGIKEYKLLKERSRLLLDVWS